MSKTSEQIIKENDEKIIREGFLALARSARRDIELSCEQVIEPFVQNFLEVLTEVKEENRRLRFEFMPSKL